MKKIILDESYLKSATASSLTAPGRTPSYVHPNATTLPAATQLGSQVSSGAAPSLAPKAGNGRLSTEQP
jgi:hypothetical protein